MTTDPSLNTPGVWTLQHIAEYLGVTMMTVHTYRTRKLMPECDGRLGRTPYWHPETITTWAAQRQSKSRIHNRLKPTAESFLK